MSKKRIVWVGVVVALLLLSATTVLADGPEFSFDDGHIFVDEDVSLEPGETFNGDLGVLNGDLTIPEDSVVNGDVFVTEGAVDLGGRVNGDLAIVNGDLLSRESGQVSGDVFGLGRKLDVAGQIDGDLSNLFGDMVLRSTAVIHGDLLALSGTLDREPGATVLGEQVSEIPFILPEMPVRPDVPQLTPPEPPEPPLRLRSYQETLGQRIGRFVGRSLAAAFLGLIFVGLGLLIVFVWPRQTKRLSDCIVAMPVQSFGLGLLTYFIAAGLEALAAVLMILIILVAAALIETVILIPIGLLLILLSVLVLLPVPVALAGAMVMGWVGLADLTGRKVLSLLKVQDVRPAGAVLVGMLLTVGVSATLWLVKPLCCGWPFVILLTGVGLGAVIHTRFGTQACRALQAATESEPLSLDAMDEESGQPDTA